MLIAQNGFDKHFWIDLLLTILVWFPGFIYALWVIFRKKDKKSHAEKGHPGTQPEAATPPPPPQAPAQV